MTRKFAHFCILSTLISASALAGEPHDDIQVTRNSQQNIILSTPCSMIDKATENLSNLTAITRDQDRCSVDITEALPEKMRKLHDTFALHDGPNCWNTSLYLSGTVQTRRHVSDQEMKYLTDSPICRKLNLVEKLEIGDVIALHYYGEGPQEFHGFNYINDLISFTKFGFSRKFDYEVISSNYVFFTFALGLDIAKPFCRRTDDLPAQSDCNVFATYYRCQDRNEYLVQAEFPTKSAFLLFDQKIRELENMISEATVGRGIWNKSRSHYFLQKTQEAKIITENWIQKISATNEAESFFWKSTLEKLKSLQTQIELLDQERKEKSP